MGDPRAATAHFGDPCIFCNVPHDEIAKGPCPANDGKLRVAGFVKIATRWDGYITYRYRTTDGHVREAVSHTTARAPYYHFGLSDDLTIPPPYDASLKAARVTA